MNRLICALTAGAVAASVALAQEAAVNDLKSEKSNLEAKRKELQGQYEKARNSLLASDAFSKERAAIEKAEKALQERRQTDKDLAKARAALATAQRDLDEVIGQKAAATKEVQAAMKEAAELEAKVPEIQFKKRLLQLNLNHEGSPVQLDLAEDKSVIEAEGALAAAQEAFGAKPAETTTTARKSAAKAAEAFRKADGEIRNDKSLRKAGEAVAEASAELRAAESKDKALMSLAKAREDVAKARQEAVRNTSSAKAHVKDLDEIAARRKELDAIRRGVWHVGEVNRKAILAGKDKDVAKAAEAVEKAKKALEKECESRAIAKARKAADDSSKAFDEKHSEFFGSVSEYTQLTAKETELQQKLSAMDRDILDATSPKAIMKLAPEVRKISQEIADIGARKRQIRISTGKDKWDAVYNARADATGALKAAIASDAGASAAAASLKAAEAALAKAVESAFAATKAGAACAELGKELAVESKKLSFREAVASLYLNDRDSAVKAAIEKDARLLKAVAELQEQEAQVREKPSNAIVKARKALAEANAEAGTIRAKLEQDEEFKRAAALKNATEQELRKLEASAPAREKAEEAKKALDKKRAEALAGMRAARKIMDEIKQLDDELAATQAARTKVAELQKQARAKVDTADDKQLAAARKTIEAAKASVKAAEESKAFQELQKDIQEAKVALDQAKKDAEAKDKGLLAVKKQISEANAAIDAVAGKINEVAKKAAEEKKQAEAKAPTPSAK